MSRVVATGVPHHVTQRGNAQRCVFETDADRLVYLQLLGLSCLMYDLSVVGFCLMSNHVHLVAVPGRAESMALAFRQTHGRDASYLNGLQTTSGHVWQGRFYSCPLDGKHLWSALRYTELNPVRAGMVAEAALWPWSSAATHCGRPARQLAIDLADEPWGVRWTPDSWREFLDAASAEQDLKALRNNTHTGRPLGGPEFVASLEQTLGRRLVTSKGGRPRKQQADTVQQALALHETC
jgi:putative transposase